MRTQHNERRVALVIGASSGLGHATAKCVLSAGFRVFGTSRSGAGVPPGCDVLTLDVCHEESLQQCLVRLSTCSERLDLLVNNAGIARIGSCEETSAEEIQELMDTNVLGPVRMVQPCLPLLRRQPRSTIVNVGSLSGSIGVPFHGAYAASKRWQAILKPCGSKLLRRE